MIIDSEKRHKADYKEARQATIIAIQEKTYPLSAPNGIDPIVVVDHDDSLSVELLGDYLHDSYPGEAMLNIMHEVFTETLFPNLKAAYYDEILYWVTGPESEFELEDVPQYVIRTVQQIYLYVFFYLTTGIYNPDYDGKDYSTRKATQIANFIFERNLPEEKASGQPADKDGLTEEDGCSECTFLELTDSIINADYHDDITVVTNADREAWQKAINIIKRLIKEFGAQDEPEKMSVLADVFANAMVRLYADHLSEQNFYSSTS